MKFPIGTKVRTKTAIMSDDRMNGIDDGSPVIPPNTIGYVIGESIDLLKDGHELKERFESCVCVCFTLDNCKCSFDLHESEFDVC